MKDYKTQISYENMQSILNFAIEKGYDVDIKEGTLNDTYVIYTENVFTINNVKPRKFMVLYPQFASAWHNTFHILMTDDEAKIEEFLPRWYNRNPTK